MKDEWGIKKHNLTECATEISSFLLDGYGAIKKWHLPLCIASIWYYSVMAISHKRTVPSLPPLTINSFLGLNATLMTPFACPYKGNKCSPDLTSHRRIVPSILPLASSCPSGLKDTVLTLSVCPVMSSKGLLLALGNLLCSL